MTDNVQPTIRDVVKSRLKKRYNTEKVFRLFGVTMAGLAMLAAATLLVSIFAQAIPAFSESRLVINYPLEASKIDPSGSKDKSVIRSQGDFGGIIVDQLIKRFPNAENDGGIDTLMEMVTQIATTPIAKHIAEHPELIGKTIKTDFALNDDVDMFLKGGFGKAKVNNIATALEYSSDGQSVKIASNSNGFKDISTQIDKKLQSETAKAKSIITSKQSRLKSIEEEIKAMGMPNMADPHYVELDNIRSQMENDISTAQILLDNAKSGQNGEIALNDNFPSLIAYANGGAFKVTKIAPSYLVAENLVTPQKDVLVDKPQKLMLQYIETPQEGRPIDDRMIAYGTILKNEGLVKQQPNLTLLSRSDSNDPEMAGLLSAIVGSILTLLVTFSITVPVGILAAIYLEEFAPKNAITDIIEVNINNLAAVPSIVFGLLGFSVFLHFFGLPRSAPIVGGIVLALMSLPVIIIASRAALKAVPPSIREAALGVGASKVQAVFHHVLPMALPGMMTGSILAMAHALGETAPLLMIGMVAFIADLPKGFSDAATVLPVEVYMWAGRPERAWDARTSAAIIVLLLFMIVMNLSAIYLRRKFERRW
jgi:phosphate transport system permease protein